MNVSHEEHRARRRRELRSTFPCPAVYDSSRLIRGNGTLAQQFKGEEHNLQELVRNARRAGLTPGIHDVYKPALAAYPLDPTALVPHSNPDTYVRRLCEKRGIPCRGVVHVDAPQREPEPDTGPPIAQDIIDRQVDMQIQQNPSLKGKRKKLEEDFINQHGPS